MTRLIFSFRSLGICKTPPVAAAAVLSSTAYYSRRADVVGGITHDTTTTQLRFYSTGVDGDDSSSIPLYKVTTLDREKGTMSTKSMKTSEILQNSSIYARDLFYLQLTSKQDKKRKNNRRQRRSTSHSSATAILPRGKQILVNFGAIRAVVGTHEVWLFDAHSLTVKEFAIDLQKILDREWNKQQQNHGWSHPSTKNVPFELVVLEAVLRETTNVYHRRLYLYDPILDRTLDGVSNDIFSDLIHRMAPLKDSLQAFELSIKQSLECVSGLLNNDDDMLALLLTEQHSARQSGTTVDYSRHESVELLLEEYGRQLNNILLEVQFLLSRLQSKQEFIQLALSSFRNRMIRMNLYLGITGLSLGITTAVAGFFGMNLVSGMEGHPEAFYIVLATTSATSAAVAAGCIQFVSSSSTQRHAKQRLCEIEGLTNALSDMQTLDLIMKQVVVRLSATTGITKEEFGTVLQNADVSSQIKQRELDLLFDSLDQHQDGVLLPNDFSESNRGRN